MSIEALDEFAKSDSAGATPPVPPKPPAPSAKASDDEQLQIPLDLGSDTDDPLALDGNAAPASKSRVPTGLILLGVVLVVAAGSLYAMRLTSKFRGNTAEFATAELQIEQALAALRGQTADADAGPVDSAMLKNTDEVVAMFANDPTGKQVDLDHLNKNPFSLRLQTRVDPNAETTGDTTPAPVVDMSAQLRARQLRAEVDKLQLQTVMNGRVPMAVVSGQIVREGDKVGSLRVAAIEKMSIVLDADGNTYRLSMDQPRIGN